MRKILFFIIFILGASNALALTNDSNQKMNIVAASTLFNYKSGVDTYEGNVRIDQGSTHLTADRVITVRNSQRKIEEATAYGLNKLAEYTTILKTSDPVFHAKAKIIKFFPLKSTVILEGDVIVSQGENSFKGPLVVYNMKDQIITAPASKNGRATIIIDPKQMHS